MRKKTDFVLLFLLITVSGLYYTLGKDSPGKKDPINLLVPIELLNSVDEIEISGSYKNQAVLHKTEEGWYWLDQEKNRQTVVPQVALGALSSVFLGAEISAESVPIKYFHKANWLRLSSKASGEDLIISISTKKSLSGEVYIKRFYQGENKVFLLPHKFEKVIYPKLVRWFGNKLFERNFTNIKAIEYFDAKNSSASSIVFNESSAVYKKNNITLVFPKKIFLSLLKELSLFESYPVKNFDALELVGLGFPENKRKSSIKIILEDSSSFELLQSLDPDQENTFLFPERSLIVSGLDKDLGILKADFLKLVNLNSYNLVEIEHLESFSCFNGANGNSVSFLKKDDGRFHSKENSHSITQLMENIYRLDADKMKVAKADFPVQLRLILKQKAKKDLVFELGYKGDELFFSRKDRDFFFKASESSKLYMKKIMNLCFQGEKR